MATIVNDKDKILQAATVRLPAILGNGIYFSNPAPVFRTLSAGGAEPSNYVIQAKFFGQITGTVSWSVISGIVSTTGQSGNTWNLAYSHLGSDSAVIRATLVYLGTTYTNELTVSRISDARSVALTTPTQTFTYTSTGTNPNPVSSTITATAYNVATTAYFEFLVNGTSVQNGTSATLNYTPTPAFSGMPQQITVRLRENSTIGVVIATDTISMQASKPGIDGPAGDKTISTSLYQWGTSQPANPSGTSTFTWSNGVHSNYTGVGGWQTTVPANPGNSLVKLWSVTKTTTSLGTATTTTVSWSSDYTVADITQNGAAGSQVAKAAAYRWGTSIPGGLSGTAIYTWSSGAISSTPSGWSLTPGSPPSAGMNLYKAEVNVTDTATATTTTFSWTNASIIVAGYAGTNGSTGAQGVSSRYAYARITNGSVPVSGTYTVNGDTLPSGTGTWGAPFNTTWSALDPNPSSTNTLYQTDGLYNPVTNQTTWTTPYVSSLKVGSLSAVTANTGDLTVTGDFKAGTAQVSGTTMTGAGGILKNGGTFAFGNATTNIAFNGSQLTLNGNVVNTNNINLNQVTVPATNGGSVRLPISRNGMGQWQPVLSVSVDFGSTPVSSSIVLASVNILFMSGSGQTASFMRVRETVSNISSIDNGVTHTNSVQLTVVNAFTNAFTGVRTFVIEIGQLDGPSYEVGNANITVLGSKR
jgi:hypothetical protein